MAGNSSSGVIEAPLLGMPVLNIGARQAGRLCHGRVLDVPPDFESIAAGLEQVLQVASVPAGLDPARISIRLLRLRFWTVYGLEVGGKIIV